MTPQLLARKPKILLVDDSPTSRQLVKLFLKKLDCKIQVAENGQEAIDNFYKFKFDLVLMDCQMPVMDGYQAARKIREFEGKSRHTPIVAMTGATTRAEEDLCYSSGMDDFCAKPLSLDSLKKALMKFKVIQE